MNCVILLGRLGKDPEVRYTAAGKAVATLSLATSQHYKDAQGAKQEATQWHRLVAWGKLAEVAQKYFRKGDLLAVEGRLAYNQWEKNGQKHTTAEVVVEKVKKIWAKSDDANRGGGQHEAGNAPDDWPF
jgi:single-strand DNA-binding protein